ncbi:hypothetical protein BJX62DRAFT_235428 [Aspergillus germanicus]
MLTIHSERDTSLYTIAWIACDNDEYQAARLMLDEQHGDYAPRQRFCGGSWYTLGEAAGNKVVLIMAIADDDQIRELACLSIDLEIHFPNVRACMVISVGAVFPREGHDVRLGDVVVKTPDRQCGGVVNVDEDYVGEPNPLLDGVKPATLAIARLLEQDIRTGLGPGSMLKHRADMKAIKPKLETEYAYPGAEKDLLFPSQ